MNSVCDHRVSTVVSVLNPSLTHVLHGRPGRSARRYVTRKFPGGTREEKDAQGCDTEKATLVVCAYRELEEETGIRKDRLGLSLQPCFSREWSGQGPNGPVSGSQYFYYTIVREDFLPEELRPCAELYDLAFSPVSEVVYRGSLPYRHPEKVNAFHVLGHVHALIHLRTFVMKEYPTEPGFNGFHAELMSIEDTYGVALEALPPLIEQAIQERRV